MNFVKYQKSFMLGRLKLNFCWMVCLPFKFFYLLQKYFCYLEKGQKEQIVGVFC